jgi:GTPase SAR1 family protein/membrane protein implicated in regulation of membrane protease activity
VTPKRGIRILLALGVLVLTLGGFLLVLLITESALNVQTQLAERGGWLGMVWWGALAVVSLMVGGLLWRLLLPRRKRTAREAADKKPPDEQAIARRIEQAEQIGVDTAAVRAELERLKARRAAGEIQVALFGDISTGKSALIRALLPGAEARSDVVGGTTRALERYRWQSPAGDALILTDMPGTAEVQGELDPLARDEAMRSHVVIYVCDGDLTRTQFVDLGALTQLGKPLVLALNKADRYSTRELALLRTRLRERMADVERLEIVSVSAGGPREVSLITPDGREERVERDMPPRVDDLAAALQRIIDGDAGTLDQLRDSAVFVLVAQQLDEATARARRQQAEALVEGYSKKAVVGALAAITPGADLLIQGYLGTQMIRELGALYDIQVRKVDVDLLLSLVQKHVGRASTLILAVAGNGLKAFPGVGTLAGGILHAVAYGIIFRTLGRALVITLDTRGELHPVQTATVFKETLGENLETSAGRFARMAIEQARKDPQDGADGR